MASVEERYGPPVDGLDPTELFIIEMEGQPVGFVQWYAIDADPQWKTALAPASVPTGSAGIDYLIGEEELVGRGLGPTMIDQFVAERLAAHPEIGSVAVDVSTDNRRSWRGLEKAGFRRIWEGQLESGDPSDEGPSYVYLRRRPDDAEKPDNAGYIRGGGGVQVDQRRLARVLASIGIVVLAGTSAGLAVSTANQNSNSNRLRTAVPVALTVTGCDGISSGIGMAIEYWQCRADYTFAGHHFNEVIGGSRASLASGQQVNGVVVPSDPKVISLATALPRRSSYVPAIAVGAIAGAGLLLLLVSWRRR